MRVELLEKEIETQKIKLVKERCKEHKSMYREEKST